MTLRARRLLWYVARLLAQFVFLLAFRVRVFGQRNVPRTGGVLLVSNHQSYLDPVLLGLGVGRPVSYMARRSLFRNRPFGWLISALNAFPVTRGGRDIGALRAAVNRLKAGGCLVVFAEGTRTTDGTIGKLMPGLLTIAGRAEAPIVPVMIEGAFRAWPRGGLPGLHPIAVRHGRPIDAEACRRMGREEFIARLRAEMLSLQSALRQGAIRARDGCGRAGEA